MAALLEVQDLHTYFYTDRGIARAVEGLSFQIEKKQTMALVGESGCGKTVTALSIMRLVPQPSGKIVQGQINLQGRNLLALPESQMRVLRGSHIAMVFQEPMSALNPLYTIGYQVSEAIFTHRQIPKSQVRKQVIKLFDQVEIPSAAERFNDYPHQLSGGLRQRAMLAQGLACSPGLLIADEPTTALDVTIQAQILKLFSRLKENKAISIMLITHDLGIVAEVADRVCVMYAGRLLEEADCLTIFRGAGHPYTQGLLNSIRQRARPRQRLQAIPGTVPQPEDKPRGCSFSPRCDKSDLRCREQLPELVEVEKGHRVRCWKPQ